MDKVEKKTLIMSFGHKKEGKTINDVLCKSPAQLRASVLMSSLDGVSTLGQLIEMFENNKLDAGIFMLLAIYGLRTLSENDKMTELIYFLKDVPDVADPVREALMSIINKEPKQEEILHQDTTWIDGFIKKAILEHKIC